MADDVMIEGLYGDYAGKRLVVPEAAAKQAIKDGWAKDPFAAPSDKPAEPIDDDKRFKILEAASKAGKALRGEAADAEAKTETRAMEAEDSGEYQTRSAKSKK